MKRERLLIEDWLTTKNEKSQIDFHDFWKYEYSEVTHTSDNGYEFNKQGTVRCHVYAAIIHFYGPFQSTLLMFLFFPHYLEFITFPTTKREI